jgi:hypothetical protein
MSQYNSDRTNRHEHPQQKQRLRLKTYDNLTVTNPSMHQPESQRLEVSQILSAQNYSFGNYIDHSTIETRQRYDIDLGQEICPIDNTISSATSSGCKPRNIAHQIKEYKALMKDYDKIIESAVHGRKSLVTHWYETVHNDRKRSSRNVFEAFPSRGVETEIFDDSKIIDHQNGIDFSTLCQTYQSIVDEANTERIKIGKTMMKLLNESMAHTRNCDVNTDNVNNLGHLAYEKTRINAPEGQIVSVDGKTFSVPCLPPLMSSSVEHNDSMNMTWSNTGQMRYGSQNLVNSMSSPMLNEWMSQNIVGYCDLSRTSPSSPHRTHDDPESLMFEGDDRKDIDNNVI